MASRAREHLNPKKKSAIVSHLQECVPCRSATTANFSILRRCNKFDLGVHEALQIRKSNPSLNVKLYNQGAEPHCTLVVF